MAATFTESESELAVGAAKRKRKRRRTPGGLGRGLARILTDSQAAPEPSQSGPSGLLQLVGGESNAKSDKIRNFVVDTALSTMVEGFSLDGVVLAAQGPPAVGGSPVPDAEGLDPLDRPPVDARDPDRFVDPSGGPL
ncbi:MAG: hypothetical protein ACR2QK_17890, partial [Acidimicrobiales bacterium]